MNLQTSSIELDAIIREYVDLALRGRVPAEVRAELYRTTYAFYLPVAKISNAAELRSRVLALAPARKRRRH